MYLIYKITAILGIKRILKTQLQTNYKETLCVDTVWTIFRKSVTNGLR